MTKSTGLRMRGVRTKALATGAVRYFTGLACKDGHVAERTTSNGTCVVCQVAVVIRWQKKNPERVKKWASDVQKRELLTNPERQRARKRLYKERHPSRIKEKAADYYERNKDRISAAKTAWIEKHPSARSEWQRTRVARKLMAMPPWADRDEIKKIYELAAVMTEKTGIKHSVDHFYPLQGKTVCGLHIALNLRVIPLIDNIKKNRSMPLSD